MKILIVATNREQSPFPVAPLGALCVAAAARAAEHDVDLLDLGFAPSPPRALRRALAAAPYQAVGFSIRNLDNCFYCMPRSYTAELLSLAATLRESFHGPLILGGSGFSVAPHGWMRRLKPDYGVIGEGEQVFVQLLGRLAAGQSAGDLPGVIAQEAGDKNLACGGPCPPVGGTAPGVRPPTPCSSSQSVSESGMGGDPPASPAVCSHGAAPAIADLAALAPPAHEFCRYNKYLARGGFVSVQTKRGCPFGCVYCIYPRLEGRRYRLRPPGAVADEVAGVIQTTKSRHFFFIDSVFNDPREHALAVCAELTRRRLPARWMAFCNPVGFDLELARAMVAAGCVGIEFGLDAATPKMLAALGKPFDQAQIRAAMQAVHAAGLPFSVHMLFGGPGETWQDIEQAQLFLNDCAPANGIFASFGIRVYEGTPLAARAAREGLLPPGHDLFEPFFYLSPALAEDTEANLDRIVRRRPEWTSPVDWRKPLLRGIQFLLNRLGVRPQWKNVRNYGLRMRR